MHWRKYIYDPPKGGMALISIDKYSLYILHFKGAKLRFLSLNSQTRRIGLIAQFRLEIVNLLEVKTASLFQTFAVR